MMCNASQPAANCPPPPTSYVALTSSSNFLANDSNMATAQSWSLYVEYSEVPPRAQGLENLINVTVWLIWALVVFGNILVISVIVRDRELFLKPANIFILNLSTSDLMVGLISMTFQNLWRITEQWVFGEALCKIWTIVDFASTTQSAFAVVLISFDRFMLVSTGLKYKQHITVPKTYLLVIVTWACALVVNAIPILLSDELLVPWVEYSVECDFAVMYNFSYQLAMFVLSFVLPIILVAVFNITVYSNIRQRAKRFQTARLRTTNSMRSSQGRSTSDFKKHRKAAITLALIVGVFLVCWVPYWINKLVVLLTLERPNPVSESDAVAYLLWANSAVNPFLYAVTNPRIRQGMISALRWPFPKALFAQQRGRGNTEYNMAETNMTKMTSQDAD